MGFQIQDGTGSNRKVRVGISNRLFVESTIRSEREEEALLGEAYIVGSGFVELTTTGTSAVLYFKNNEDVDLVITRFLVGVKASAGGTENFITGIIYKNPTSMTGGTGSPLLIDNANFGSSNTIDADSEIGQQGALLVGGSPYLATVAPTEMLTAEDASTILPKGSSIGVFITPPPGNTSVEVSVGINMHKLTEELL
jgi:hypothetical protein